MPLLIGSARVAIQTGGKFNFGQIFFVRHKNNLHNEAGVNSFNQGKKNFQNSFSNTPDLEFRKASTGIIDKGKFDYFGRRG